MKRAEWEGDIHVRQRNIVFPDTVQNEGRFYRNLLRTGMPLNWVQRLGLVSLAICSFIFAVLTFATAISELMQSAFGFLFFIVYGAIGTLALFMTWRLLNRVFFSDHAQKKKSKRILRHH